MNPLSPINASSPIIQQQSNNNNNNNNPTSPNPQHIQQFAALNLFDPNNHSQQQQQQQQQALVQLNALNNVAIPSGSPLQSVHQQLANQVVSPSNSVHSSSSIPSAAIPAFGQLPQNIQQQAIQPQQVLIQQQFVPNVYQQNNNNNNGNANMRNNNNNNNNHPLSPNGNNNGNNNNNQQAAVLQEFAHKSQNNNIGNNNNRNNNNKNGRNNILRDNDNNIIHSPNASSSTNIKYPDFDYKALTAKLREEYSMKREEWKNLAQNDALFDTLDRPLVEALLLPKHRPQILEYEQKIIEFLLSDDWTFRFPANLSSFNRLLLHRLSETYKLDHHVEFVADNRNHQMDNNNNKHHRRSDDQNKAVVIYKMENTKLYVIPNPNPNPPIS